MTATTLDAKAAARDMSPLPAFSSGKPRRIYWTCTHPECGRSFKTWTRRGLRVTCPYCKRVQEGPEGVRRLVEKHGAAAAPKKPPTTTLKIVADNAAGKSRGGRRAHNPEAPGSTPGPASKTKAATKPAPKVAVKTVTPPAPAAKPKRDLVARLMGFSS